MEEKNAAAVALAALRMVRLSPGRRSEIARTAALARWSQEQPDKEHLARAGRLGGHARARSLSAERRREIAKQANDARNRAKVQKTIDLP